MSKPSQGQHALYYPVLLDVRGARCVVVGGGSVAARKVRALVEAGAAVTVVAPDICAELQALVGAGAVQVRRKPFEPKELEGARLAVAATDDPAVNEAVSREARAAGMPVNVVDQPALSTFIVPATVSRGRLQVAVSTGGASPAFAARLRERLEGLLSPRLAAYLDAMAETRAMVLERVADAGQRAAIFGVLASDEFVTSYLEAEPAAADAMLLERVRELIAKSGGTG
jgi:precorrin-2 dehydrogenase/sirohydrochlorin ferrochelatase